MPKQKNPKQSGARSRPMNEDQNISAPAAQSKKLTVRAPQVVRNGNLSHRIVHRELISTVTGTTSFAVFQSLALNPGLAASFPWLATQAAGWEQYRFNRLKFEYISRAPTTATGSVLIAPDYDVLDAPPSTELAASTYRDAVECSPWSNFDVPLKPAAMFPLGQRKFVRSGFVAAADYKTYDAGSLHVCTTGQADTSGIGKLWVDYDVEFFVPQTASAAAQNSRSYAEFALLVSQGFTSGVSAAFAPDTTVMNGLGIVNNSGVFTLPVGNWLVHAETSMSGGTSASQSLSLALQKNSAALSTPCNAIVCDAGAAATEVLQVSVRGIVQSNGSDTVRILATLTSAAGTLVLYGGMCRISFTLV